MHIQWFPGHMHRTRQKLAELMPQMDVVVEMLDARLPASSANPLLHELAAARPRLQILNKADLADAQRTDQWRRWWRQQGKDSAEVAALALAAGQKGNARRVQAACRLLAPQRGGLAKPLRVLICGVPNVGKSTLINALLGKKQAATGNEPGITKNEARMVLDDDFYLWDSPGMLWPRIDAPQSAANLAASGAVGRNAYDARDVALHLLDYLQRRYPQSLSARYRMAHADGQEWLHALARQHSNGDAHQAAERVLKDFRGAALGRITLETPQEFAQWQAQARQNDLARAEKRQAGKTKKIAVITEKTSI